MSYNDRAIGYQIEGEGLDTEAIVHQIQARIHNRRAEAQASGLDWKAYAEGLYPLPPDAILSHQLHESVRHLQLGYDKTGVEMDLTETRLPIVGGLAHRLRSALHELVLFYVNRLSAKQTRVNGETARALTALVHDLEAELSRLHDRVAELEAGQE